jgi:hypothetical protein
MLIPGFPNYDMSSEFPHSITNVKTGRVKKFQFDYDGYYTTRLYANGKGRTSKRARWLALCFIPNPDNKPTVDHMNRDRTDDRIENIRWATQAEQNINRILPMMVANNTSGARGVSWNKRLSKWHAQTKFKGTRIHIGYFDSVDDAKAAYEMKKRELNRN